MLWAVTGVTFMITILVGVGLFLAFSPGEAGGAQRLSRLMEPEIPLVQAEGGFSQKQKDRMRDSLASLGKLLPATAGQQASRAQLQMVRAGYRSPDAMQVIRGMKVLLPIAFVSLVFFTGLYRYSPLFILLAAAGAGFILPEMWLSWRIGARQHRLRLALPDGLDLLVICVEVGLGMDQAILRVAEELKIVHPELSDEFKIVNLEMRVGKTRIEALRELARRTGLEDLKTLVAMLIPDGALRDEHRQVAAGPFGRTAHQETPARRGIERQDHGKDGWAACVFHFSGLDGCAFRACGDFSRAAIIARVEVTAAKGSSQGGPGQMQFARQD